MQEHNCNVISGHWTALIMSFPWEQPHSDLWVNWATHIVIYKLLQIEQSNIRWKKICAGYPACDPTVWPNCQKENHLASCFFYLHGAPKVIFTWCNTDKLFPTCDSSHTVIYNSSRKTVFSFLIVWVGICPAIVQSCAMKLSREVEDLVLHHKSLTYASLKYARIDCLPNTCGKQ